MAGVSRNPRSVVVPACRLTRSSAAQTVAKNSPTAVTFDSEAFDTDSMHSTASNTARVTINTAGVYSFWGLIQTPSVTATLVIAYVYKNGVSIAQSNDVGQTTTQDAASVSCVYEGVIGDYFELRAYWFGAAAGPATFANANFSAAFIGSIV